MRAAAPFVLPAIAPAPSYASCPHNIEAGSCQSERCCRRRSAIASPVTPVTHSLNPMKRSSISRVLLFTYRIQIANCSLLPASVASSAIMENAPAARMLSRRLERMMSPHTLMISFCTVLLVYRAFLW